MRRGVLVHIAFYRFTALPGFRELKPRLLARLGELGLKGTILLAPEGINGALSGDEASLREFQAWLEALPGFEGMTYRESRAAGSPFARLKVKLKREIVPFGVAGIEPHRRTGRRLQPAELKRWLDEGRPVRLLDTRNEFEIAHGTFRGARSLGLSRFRDLTAKLREAAPGFSGAPVVMFCTGGIRCEKATALALELGLGLEDVYQLEGGILKYLEECGSAHYDGACYVFDAREALGPGDLSASRGS